jgi:uncharacterized protein (TIGR00730 family)
MALPLPSAPPDSAAQRASPSYRLPVEDTEFLLRDEMRATRFGLEYAKAELSLRDRGIRSTIVVFGSARIPSPEQAAALLAEAPAAEADPTARARAERRAAPRRAVQAAWYAMAREFARIASERGGALAPNNGVHDNVIATGGGPSIMEAANRGASEAGAPSIGFNITLPVEQQPNAWSTPDLTFRFHYFAMRKMHLAMRANALAVFPGGFGTMDELFEILTLTQTRKAPGIPIVLFGRHYWERVIDFAAMAEEGMVDTADLSLFEIVDNAEDGWTAMVRRGLAAHAPAERASVG